MISRDNSVLVLIDIQGTLAQIIHERDFILENMRKVIQGCQILEIPILLTEQVNLGETIPEITEFLPGIRPIIKESFSCCGNQEFMDALKSLARTQVLIAGLETHVCVHQTTLDLLDHGYQVQIIADAISSRTSENRKIALQKMRDCGAKWTSTEMVLFELLKTAADPKLRDIIKIVK